MPLPQQVVEQLGREPVRTQGWASGALLFGSGILFLAILIWVGLSFGYEPYLQNQLNGTKSKIDALNNSVSTAQENQLISYYSQTANLRSLLRNHIVASQFFSWLEENTEANVYYQSFNLGSQDHVSMVGSAATEADVNQQIAIFENSPEVVSADVSNVTAPMIPGGQWSFNITLVMQPSIFAATYGAPSTASAPSGSSAASSSASSTPQ